MSSVESVSRIADHLADWLDNADFQIQYRQDKLAEAQTILNQALSALHDAKTFKDDLLNTIDVLHTYEDNNEV